MKRTELVVQLTDVWDLEGVNGPVEPLDISAMLRSFFRYQRMLAAAWLILHYNDSLHCGHWPQSALGPSTSHGGAFHHGPQEVPGAYAAMVSARLKECGQAGELCQRYYEQQPVAPGEDADVFNPSPEQCQSINDALLYAATWRERHCTFNDWRYRNRARKGRRDAKADAKGMTI
jgi:hypothetical protein